MTSISLVSPANGSTLTAPPTFCWAADGECQQGFAVDFSILPDFRTYWSTLKYIGVLNDASCWTMPAPIWDRIPSGGVFFWRVRGADMDAAPLTIINSDEVWTFTKP
jgi:hypothetical protein